MRKDVVNFYFQYDYPSEGYHSDSILEPIFKMNELVVAQQTNHGDDYIPPSLVRYLFPQDETDMFFIVGGEKFRCHRSYVSSKSRVFKALLDTKKPWIESKNVEIKLVEDPRCEEYFAEFMLTIYEEFVLITSEMAVPLLILANKYMLKNLEIKCLKVLCCKLLSSPVDALRDFMDLLLLYYYGTYEKFADPYFWKVDRGELIRNSYEEIDGKFAIAVYKIFIKNNFVLLMKLNEPTEFWLDIIKAMVMDDDIVLDNEFQLFKAVEKWINANEFTEDEIKAADNDRNKVYNELSQKVLQYIKYPLMHNDDMSHLCTLPVVTKNESFLGEFFHVTFSYLYGEHVDPYYTTNTKLFTPRIYMNVECGYSVDIHIEDNDFYPRQTAFYAAGCTWVMKFDPAGVRFEPAVVEEDGTEVPASVITVSRLSLVCMSPARLGTKVKVALMLIYNYEESVVVTHVGHALCRFTVANNEAVLDNAVPYSILNNPALSHDYFLRFLVIPAENALLPY